MIEGGLISNNRPQIRESDRLTFAAILALAFHGLIFLGIVFTVPEEGKRESSPSMQVVLAQYHSDEKPEEAKFVGQDNQMGGGNEQLDQVPTTTEVAQIPDPSRQASLSAAQSSVEQQRQPTPEVMTANGQNQVFLEQQVDAPEQSDETLLDTATLMQRYYEVAGLNAQLDDQQRVASENLRKRQASAATHRSSDALYLDTWRRRIEEVGNRNYPEAARNRGVHGELILKVAVNVDGTIRDIDVMSSSGHQVLDEAAIQIVRLAAPFDPFDETLRQDTDVLEIVRLWQFLPGDVMTTQ